MLVNLFFGVLGMRKDSALKNFPRLTSTFLRGGKEEVGTGKEPITGGEVSEALG